jgi:GLPGLI family protein
MKYLTILAILFFNYLFSQDTNYNIFYNMRLTDDATLFTKNEFLKQSLKDAAKEKNEIKFTLECIENVSKFSVANDIKNSEDNSVSFSLAIASYSGDIYNFKNDSILKQCNILGDKYYTKQYSNKNWNITTESKMIDTYTCYKATTILEVIGEDRVFKHPIVAWFCPQIPIKHGPNGFGNLPGLIVELNYRNVTFFMKSFSINQEKVKEISKLKNIIILSEMELNKKLIEFNNFENK